MGRVLTSLAFGALMSITHAEVFTLSLGDLNQYSASLATTPTLSGSRVIFTDSPSPNSGVDAVLSEDLRANIQKAVDASCKTIDSQCIGSIKNLLINPRTELESRQLGPVVPAVVLFFALIAGVWEVGKDGSKGVPLAIHIPPAQVAEAASAAEAATIAAVTGVGAATPFVTFVPKLPATTILAPDKPTETILSSPQDGHAPGDLSIRLSEDLAKRLTEMIERNRQCAAGNGRPSAKDAHVKDFHVADVLDNIGEIECASKSIILNGFPGGPFGELYGIDIDPVIWASQAMMDMLAGLTSFALSVGKGFASNPGSTTTLALYAAYLSYMQIQSRKPLGAENWIAGSDFKGIMSNSPIPTMVSATPTMLITATTTASSSSLLECSASCTMVGNMRGCNTWCPTPTDEGYTRPTDYAVKTVAFEPWHVPAPQIPMQVPIGVCPPPPGNATDFPLDKFKDVYTRFCEQNGGTKASTIWVVNANGDHLQSSTEPKSRLRRFVSRASAPDGDKYKGYEFTLSSTFRGDAANCLAKCDQAYAQLSRQDVCKRGDGKKAIADTGFIDAGCVSWSFSVKAPKAPEVKADITCSDSNGQFSAPKYDSTGSPSVESSIKSWCASNDQTYLTSANDQKYGRFDITQLDVPKRSSFWPHVTLGDPNQKAVLVKEQCIAAFTNGLKQCDSGSDRTHGFTAVVGTAKYSLELSGLTQDATPPWSKSLSFPPSEFQSRYVAGDKDTSDPWGVQCDAPNTVFGKPIFPNDLEKAIDSFCVNGAGLKEFDFSGNKPDGEDGFTRYPPKGQPQFYQEGQHVTTHLEIGAEPLNRSGRDAPYWDKRACEGFDWKRGADDCRYALRKILKQCNDKEGKFNAGEYKYRCVRWKMYHSNDAKPGT